MKTRRALELIGGQDCMRIVERVEIGHPYIDGMHARQFARVRSPLLNIFDAARVVKCISGTKA
jgi:hypothetical protein